MAVRPAPAVQKLTVVEDGLLLSMAFNNKFTKEFPFLRGLQQFKGQTGKVGCGSCGRGRANNSRNDAFNQAKSTLVSMADNKRRKLKELLNTKKVRITYKQGSKVLQHTF